MSALSFIPVIGAIISFVFAYLVINQYLNRKGPHQLSWAFALMLFGFGFVGEALGLIFGWNQLSAKVYYLFGGILSVGYLSLGTIYLLKPKPAKWISLVSLTTIFILWFPIFGTKLFKADLPTAVIIILLYLATMAGVFLAPTARVMLAALITVTVLSTFSLSQHYININTLMQSGSWREVMTVPLRSSAFALSAVGTLVLIIGAVYSSVTGWSDKKTRPYVYSTVLIALGVLIAASGGTLHGIFGVGKQMGLSITTTVGIAVMFAGFLKASVKR